MTQFEYKANNYRLYPTENQARQMAQIAGACRLVHNLALEQKLDWWRPGRTFSFSSQCREITLMRAEFPWLKSVPAQPLQQAIKDLHRTFGRWFSGSIQGPPKPRKKGRNDSFRFPDPDTIKVERTGASSGRVKFPKLGWVKIRGWYPVPGDVLSATIRCRAGQWSVSISWARQREKVEASQRPPIGIDRGVSIFAALSDGSIIPSANFGRKALNSLRKAQRSLSRKKRGSENRKKAARKVAVIHARVANARKNFLHTKTTGIANNHGLVVIEALKVQSMTRSAKGTVEKPGKNVRQKSGLNRAILDQGWGAFRSMLKTKLEDRGCSLVEVSAAYTSQTCAACGSINAASRKTQAMFACVDCGHTANADTNAAINILRRGLDESLKPVEGHRIERPVEAGSIRGVA